jgi:uncharacterized membrane protein YjjP (DUF1212 family)
MKLTDVTSIGRPIDPEYPTNRAIAIITILVIVAGAVFQCLSGGGWGESILWGVQAGLAVFLAWALGRELDPDHPLAAFVAAGLAFLALYPWDLPQLGVIFWLLILVRVVNRTAGLPAGVLDALGLLGLAVWLSLQGNWGYGVITALAFLLDSQLPKRAQRQLVFALLAAITTAIAAILGDALGGRGAPSLTGGLIAVALSLLFLPVLLAARSVESVGDQTGAPLSPIRVRTAQALALLVGIETAFLGGTAALTGLAPLWAATLGASVTWLYTTLTS